MNVNGRWAIAAASDRALASAADLDHSPAAARRDLESRTVGGFWIWPEGHCGSLGSASKPGAIVTLIVGDDMSMSLRWLTAAVLLSGAAQADDTLEHMRGCLTVADD